MGFNNWEELNNFNFDQLEENDVEYWLPKIVEIDVKDENDPQRLRALFNMSKALLEIKTAQAEIALEEIEDLTKSRASTEIKKEKNDFKQQQNLNSVKNSFLSNEYDNDLLLLREEIRELTEQNQQLSKEYNNLNAEIIHEKDLVAKYSTKVDECEKELAEQRKERDELLINLREYQRRLDNENESSMSAKQMITEKLEKKLRSRNREMTQMLKEINTLTETNDSLENQVLNLKANLEECAQQMEMAADECMRLKSVNEELENLVDKLQLENAEMRDQLGGQLNKREHGMENELTETIDKKINEWKELFEQNQQQIEQYREKIHALEEEVVHYQTDSDRELEERDKQIHYLKNELKEATIEIESNVLLVQDLREELNADGKNPKRSRIRQIELHAQLRKLESKFQDARQTVEEQEKIIRSKEQELAELLVRMQQYERGEYGLEEAVKNVTTLKKRLNSKEMHLQDLVQHCNQIEIALSECLSENQQLREQFHLSPRKPLNVELRYASKVDAEKDNSLSVVLKKEVEQLEEERLELKLKIRNLVKCLAKESVDQGLSATDMTVRALEVDADDKYHCINCEKAALLKDANQQLMIRVAQLECENQRLMANAQIVQSEQNEQNLNDQENRTKTKTEVIENQTKIESKQPPKQLFDESSSYASDVAKQSYNISTLLHLPNNLQISTATLIAQLNEFLLQILHECEIKDAQLGKFERFLKSYQTKYETLRHQQGLLYQDYGNQCEKFEKEKHCLQFELEKCQTEMEKCNIKCSELELLNESLTKEDNTDDLKKRLTETIRNQIIIRIESMISKRKLEIARSFIQHLLQEKNNMKEEVQKLQCTVLQKSAYIERKRKMNAFKFADLHNRLKNSVPAFEFNQLLQKFLNLSKKHCQFLVSSNVTEPSGGILQQDFKSIDMAEDGKAIQEYESFISRVSENLQLNMLPKNSGNVKINYDYPSVQLQPEDEQEHFDIFPFEDETEPPNSDETRNSKEATLISSCTEFQDSEENALIESLMEQKQYYEKMATSLELEVAQLREAVENLQTKTDRNMTIGNLHREIVDLKLKNASIEFKAAEATERLRTCETEIAKLKTNLEEKRITVEKVKAEYKRKFLAMQKLTREIKIKYSSCISVQQLEHVSQLASMLKTANAEKEKELQNILETKLALSEAENRLKIQEACTGQLLQAVQHKTEFKQLLEWKEDIQRLKINNFILKRQNDRTVHEIDTKEKQIVALENTVDILTNDITLLQSKIEEAVLAFGKQMIQQNSMDKNITQHIVNEETNLHDYVKKLDEEIQILKRGLQSKEVQEMNGIVENQQREELLSVTSEHFTEKVDNADQKSAGDNKANENDQKPELFDTMLSLVQEKIQEKETNYKDYGEKLQQLENQIEELKSQHGREMQSQQDTALDKLGEQVVQIKEEADRLFHFLENMKTIEINAKQTIELEELLKKKDNEIEKLIAEIQTLKENETIACEKLKKSEEHLHENCLHSFSGKSPTREDENEKSEISAEECESEISTTIESRAESVQPAYRVDDKKVPRTVVQERAKRHKSTAENIAISTAEHLKMKVDLENLRRRYTSLEVENKKLLKAIVKMKTEFGHLNIKHKDKRMQNSCLSDEEESGENNKELLVLLQEEKRNLTMELENQLKITNAKQIELDASLMNNKLLTKEIETLKCQLRKTDKTLQQTIKEDSEAKKQVKSDSHSTVSDKESENFHKWEEQKKWQALLQKEKTKIEKKNEEINKLKIIEERMRDRIIRLEQRINYLENLHDVDEQTVNSKRTDPYVKTAKTGKSKLTYGKNELSPQTCEANGESLQKLEKQIAELQEQLNHKIESEKTQQCTIKQLEATVQELQNNNAHARSMMMSNHKIERKGSMIDEATIAYEEEKDPIGKDEINKLNWSVVKHEIKVTKQYSASSDAENKNMVKVSAKKGVLYPWLCGEGYSSLLAQLTAENARLRTKLIRSENELKNAWKKFDHFRYAEDKVAHTAAAAAAAMLTSHVGVFTNNNVKSQTDDRRSTAEPAKLKKRCKHLEVLLIRETENNRRQILENERLKRKVLILEAALTYDENNEKYVIQQLKILNCDLLEEIDQLKLELEIYNKQIKPWLNDYTELISQLKERRKIYDQVLKENVDLKIENLILSSKQ
ncbi:Centrosomal protein [Trichinella pseudospiralis]|uniref:Centrosomal protein n=1 Tax=Trichinella pseudospiralis TaxID=6337 RepID=A0A0V1IN42_TRIPS|nr:Centrosomal protein [Trichinella pseudospiralis]KRZ24286.1 Centrosomal protein [Trichinella pseudospiralis]